MLNKKRTNKKKDRNNETRKLKRLFCNSIFKYINNIILKVYNNNIGHGINMKKLLKINHNCINNSRADFNKQLLYKTIKDIFYHEIKI